MAVLLLVLAPAGVAHAATVTYDLHNVWLDPDVTRPFDAPRQMTGSFEWTYEEGDFENGTAQFIELSTPWYDPGIEELNVTIDPSSVELSLIGNYHDLGLDLTMFFLEPLAADQPAVIDLVRSKFEIQRGVVYQGHLVSGSVVPSTILGGDYNDDGVVNAVDYAVWRDNLGAPPGTLPNDADGGAIGAVQYATWRGMYGMSASPAPGSGAVPEPAGVWIVLLGGVAGVVARRPG